MNDFSPVDLKMITFYDLLCWTGTYNYRNGLDNLYWNVYIETELHDNLSLHIYNLLKLEL